MKLNESKINWKKILHFRLISCSINWLFKIRKKIKNENNLHAAQQCKPLKTSATKFRNEAYRLTVAIDFTVWFWSSEKFMQERKRQLDIRMKTRSAWSIFNATIGMQRKQTHAFQIIWCEQTNENGIEKTVARYGWRRITTTIEDVKSHQTAKQWRFSRFSQLNCTAHRKWIRITFTCTTHTRTQSTCTLIMTPWKSPI